MEIKISMVIQSGKRMKFVKWLVSMFPDTQERVTEEELRQWWKQKIS